MPSGRVEQFPELREFVKKHAKPDLTRREVTEMAQKKIGPVSYEQVRRVYRVEGLPFCSGNKRKQIIPDDKAEEFMKMIPGNSSAKIRELAKEQLGLDLTTEQIRTWKKNHKVASGYDTRFRSGKRSPTKGLCWNEFMSPEAQERSRENQYRKGHIPHNRRLIGDVCLRSDGYVWIKIKDGHLNENWTQYHRWTWEQANGKIPEGYKIIFLDGNTQNCKLENLAMVEESVLATANKLYKMTTDPEVNKAIIKAAELKIAITKAERRKKKK